MLSIPHYVMLWCILFTIIGAVWYNLDRRYGVKLYRWWYDLTHKDPLPEGEQRGFVYNRSTKARFTAAWVVSTVQSVAVILTTPVNPLVELIMWLFEVPVTMLGFYLGPYLYRLWQRSDVVFDAMDRLEHRAESGDIDVKATAAAASRAIRHRFASTIHREEEHSGQRDPEPEEKTTEAATVNESAENDSGKEDQERASDPRELMRSYARKRQSS